MNIPESPISHASTTLSSDLEKGTESQLGVNDDPKTYYQMVRSSLKKLVFLREIFRSRICQTDHDSGDETSCVQIRILEDKHRGYRSLSTFLDSDENFMVYRRFGYLHSRILLRKQDQLRKLEAELDLFDDEDVEEACSEDQEVASRSRRLLMSRDFDEAECKKELPGMRTRTDILNDIETKLKEYGELLLQDQSLVALNKPASRDLKSVQNYMFDKKPLLGEEGAFIREEADLITLRDGRELALLDGFMERLLRASHCSLVQRIFCSKADRAKTTDPHLHYYTKARKDHAITAILTLVLLCLLVVPVFLLNKLTSDGNMDVTHTISIGVLIVFTLIFSAVLSLFTQAKRHEIFGASAAYCAVLVVFISNIPGLKS